MYPDSKAKKIINLFNALSLSEQAGWIASIEPL
jgi:hypothetical protein